MCRSHGVPVNRWGGGWNVLWEVMSKVTEVLRKGFELLASVPLECGPHYLQNVILSFGESI